MATLFKEISETKLNGKVYTPPFIVNKILDEIGYRGKAILGKFILDPACGDGRFLVEIVKRVIKYSEKKDLINNLSCVYGWDIDEKAVSDCIKELGYLIKDLSIKVKWNITLCDTLKKIENLKSLFKKEDFLYFDFIVGNPPYIRIQHLEEKQRRFIQTHYDFCQNGSTDIFIAFFEFSYLALKQTGICGLITPNTFLTTQTASVFRKHLEENQNIIKIINYGEIQLFENATTYSAITIFGRKKSDHFIYEKAINRDTFEKRNIPFSEIQGKKFWQLSTKYIQDRNGKSLKDICEIHCGLATLADKVYIFPIKKIDEKYVLAETKYAGQVKIEKAILKPIVKASRLKSSSDPIKVYILFPYKQVNGKNVIITEDELKNKYPLACKYLNSVKHVLDKRCNGEPNEVIWYAYGRTQALDTSFGEKILFSPMSNKPNFIFYGNKNATFYSGYCIKCNGDYEKLLAKLNSKDMEKYISIAGRDFREGWKSYSKKILEEFVVHGD